jgi:hypothetical protein
MTTMPPFKPGIPQVLLDDRLALPGMLPQEVVIFRTWWKANAASYTAADFNVRVGTGFDPGEKYDIAVRQSSVMSTQKRIDALLSGANGWQIVEVKYRATPLVIGQIVCYALLWMRDNPRATPPKLLVLCVYTDADTRYCCGKLNIELQTVAADFTGIKIQKQ